MLMMKNNKGALLLPGGPKAITLWKKNKKKINTKITIPNLNQINILQAIKLLINLYNTEATELQDCPSDAPKIYFK